MVVKKKKLDNFITVLKKLFVKKGNMYTFEKLFLKSLKIISKNTEKRSLNLLKKSFVNSIVICNVSNFKVAKGKRKIKNQALSYLTWNKKIFVSSKFILKECKKKKKNFSICFSEEIINSSKHIGNISANKNMLGQAILILKKFSKYKWI